jgi:hypothetical protein
MTKSQLKQLIRETIEEVTDGYKNMNELSPTLQSKIKQTQAAIKKLQQDLNQVATKELGSAVEVNLKAGPKDASVEIDGGGTMFRYPPHEPYKIHSSQTSRWM